MTGAVRTSKSLRWNGGDLAVTTPAYSIDVALRMRAAARRGLRSGGSSKITRAAHGIARTRSFASLRFP